MFLWEETPGKCSCHPLSEGPPRAWISRRFLWIRIGARRSTEPSSFKLPTKDASGSSCFHGSAAQPSMSTPFSNWSVTLSMFPTLSFTTSIPAGIRRMGGIIPRIKRCCDTSLMSSVRFPRVMTRDNSASTGNTGAIFRRAKIGSYTPCNARPHRSLAGSE